jgi:autotransporter-associated beta strand protein
MGFMRKIFLSAMMLAISQIARASPPAGYWLAWSAECSSNDTTKFDNWLLGARRDAVNTGAAVSFSNGICSISTYTAGGTNYTGMISTDGQFKERYGYWEAYIDYNGMTGMWSAFWIQSPTIGNPIGDPATAGSEIDVCDHRSFDSSGSYIGGDYAINNHWDGYGASHKSVGTTVNSVGADSGFHTYGVLWDETDYQFYYDNVWKWTTTNGHSRRSQFAILSSEVENGSWAGNIPPAGYGTTNNPRAKMQTDFVRWYAPSNYTIWDGTGASGSWANTNNWVASRRPDAGRVVVFDDFTRTGFATILDTNRSIDGIIVTDPWNAVTISSNTLTLGLGGIDMEMNAHSLTINSDVVLGQAQTWNVGQLGLTVNGDISGGHSITKLGAGSLTLAGSNSYTFGTTIREGTLYVANNWALGTTGQGTTIVDGAQLFGKMNVTCPEDLTIAGAGPDGSGSFRVGSSADVVWTGSVRLTNDALIKLDGNTTLALNDTLSISNFTLSIAGDGGSVGTINSIVTGAGWVVKSGGGTWTVTVDQPKGATHWYSDSGTFNFNSCSVTATTWCGAGSTSNAGGTFALNSGSRFATSGDFNIADVDFSQGRLNIASGATLLPNTLYVGKFGNATGTVNQDDGTVTNYDATPGDWRIGGGGSGADNDAFGLYNLNGGTFFTVGNLHVGAYGHGEWLQDGGIATVAGWPSVARFTNSIGIFSISNGVFNQTGGSTRLIIGERGTATLVVASSGQVNLSGGLLIGSGAASRGTAHLNGGMLTTPLILSTGGVSTLNFNGGILRAGANSTNFISGIDTAVFQGTAIFDTAGFTDSVAQTFSGTGRLVKTGAGILTLAASNSYSGTTTISNGTLRSARPYATGIGAVSIAANGTLGGTGRVVGAVTVAGMLDPGFSIGTLPTGAQTWQSGGDYRYEISSANSTAGRDLIAVNGSLTLTATAGSPFTISLVSFSNGVPSRVPDFDNRGAYQWTLAVATSISGFASNAFVIDTASFSNALAGGTFSVAVSAATNLVLNYSPPPPPKNTSLQIATNGLPQIVGMGITGLQYWLDATSNLLTPVSWQPVTNSAATNGIYSLQDPTANPPPRRFYRVRETQP